jgi:hypothetical protein
VILAIVLVPLPATSQSNALQRFLEDSYQDVMVVSDRHHEVYGLELDQYEARVENGSFAFTCK